jgi:hypothetical protein
MSSQIPRELAIALKSIKGEKNRKSTVALARKSHEPKQNFSWGKRRDEVREASRQACCSSDPIAQ